MQFIVKDKSDSGSEKLITEKDNKAFTLILKFDKEYFVDLKIEGQERDFVFLLSSDLKDYIKHNILKMYINSLQITKILVRIAPLLIMLAFILSTLLMYNNYVNQLDVERIISSNSVAEKLNFLIEYVFTGSLKSDLSKMFLNSLTPLFVLFIILFVLSFLDKILNVIFPVNLFLIGKQKDWYEKNKKTRDNFFWVVIIGLFLSIISNIIASKITGA